MEADRDLTIKDSSTIRAHMETSLFVFDFEANEKEGKGLPVRDGQCKKYSCTGRASELRNVQRATVGDLPGDFT